MVTKHVPAGAFKQGCLAILDQVASENLEVIVTKRGRPVARVVPIQSNQEQEGAVLSRMRARVRASVGRESDLLKPTSALTPWKLLSLRERK